MPRYTRDELIVQGLELSGSPTLLQHDVPNGIVRQDAFSIRWLQNALDMCYRKYPFSSTILTASMSLGIGSNELVLSADNTKFLPTDFILDVRDGLIVQISNQEYRMQRISYQYYLNYRIQNTNNNNSTRTYCYTIVGNKILVWPMVNVGLNITLHYYALPAVLQSNDYPDFPDEWVLVEYVRLKALEWTRSLDLGTAERFMTEALAKLRASGLLHDSEYDVVPIKNNQVFLNDNIYNRYSWMGPPVGSA